MTVYPLFPVALDLLGDYPHMAPRDVAIWEAFIRAQAANYIAVAYDVAVGGQLVRREGLDEADRLGWQYATAMHIDAVLFGDGFVFACEVKPHALASAIGQALCYALLLELDGAAQLPVYPAVITDYASSDVRLCCEQLGVVLIEVSPAAPAGAPAIALPPEDQEETL